MLAGPPSFFDLGASPGTHTDVIPSGVPNRCLPLAPLPEVFWRR